LRRHAHTRALTQIHAPRGFIPQAPDPDALAPAAVTLGVSSSSTAAAAEPLWAPPSPLKAAPQSAPSSGAEAEPGVSDAVAAVLEASSAAEAVPPEVLAERTLHRRFDDPAVGVARTPSLRPGVKPLDLALGVTIKLTLDDTPATQDADAVRKVPEVPAVEAAPAAPEAPALPAVEAHAAAAAATEAPAVMDEPAVEAVPAAVDAPAADVPAAAPPPAADVAAAPAAAATPAAAAEPPAADAAVEPAAAAE
jgi:hypothetical protein